MCLSSEFRRLGHQQGLATASLVSIQFTRKISHHTINFLLNPEDYREVLFNNNTTSAMTQGKHWAAFTELDPIPSTIKLLSP